MIRGGGGSKRSDPVRIGVVGAGRWGRVHALTLAAMGETELVGLVEPRRESLDAILPQLPGVRVWSDLDKALKESSDAEAWIVATTTATHVPVTRKILETGKPVLLEKPICDDLAEARTLASLVKPDSSNLMLGHVMLFNTEVRQLLIQQRKHKGRIVLVNACRHRSTDLVKAYHGENPLFLVMVHDMYVTQALMGGREPMAFKASVHYDKDDKPDLAAAIVQWEDGAIASLVASHITPPAMPLEGFDRMEVFGEGWCARIDTSPRPIEVWDDRYIRPLSLEINEAQPNSTGMLAEELRCFCRVVRGEEPVPAGATYQDAMQVEAWLQKLDAASRDR
jgi:predicted dehydrogenase